MVVVDLTRNLYFASTPPWSHKQGLVVKHKPHQTSAALKLWKEKFAQTAESLRGTYGRGSNGLPQIANEMKRLRGQGNPGLKAEREAIANRSAMATARLRGQATPIVTGMGF